MTGAPVKLTSATPPRLLKQVDPVYPEMARQARVEGVVILEATVDIYGRVQSNKILRSIPSSRSGRPRRRRAVGV